jgi:hypothetical protein
MFAAILLASAVSLGLPPCPPPTPANVFIVWASDDATCSFGSPVPCTAGVPVQFMPRGFNYNLDCYFSTFAWDFGDGFKDSRRNVVHAFTSPGSYVVSLTIATPSATVVIKESIVIDPHRASRRRAARH